MEGRDYAPAVKPSSCSNLSEHHLIWKWYIFLVTMMQVLFMAYCVLIEPYLWLTAAQIDDCRMSPQQAHPSPSLEYPSGGRYGDVRRKILGASCLVYKLRLRGPCTFLTRCGRMDRLSSRLRPRVRGSGRSRV